MKSKQIMGILLIATALLAAQPTFAKGGVSGGGNTTQPTLPTPTTTVGPCNLNNADNNIIVETALGYEMDVELVNQNLPGGAVVHVVRNTTTDLLYISNVCLDEGWAISKYKMAGAWGKDQGIDITVSYNGLDAVRYRILGQGIRFDRF